MARIRTIKPEFFRHELLQELEANNPASYVMLVFIGLFGHCDKEGRFEWRPKMLKLDILPFLDFDIGASLELLRQAKFISRYEVDGKSYGLIPTFKEHQRISGKEAQELPKYPQPNDIECDYSGEATGKQRGSTGEAVEITGREGKGKEEEGNRKGKNKYRFAASVIRLTDSDYALMRKTYHAIPDFDTELISANAQYDKEPPGNWFCALGNRLNKKHQEYLAKSKSLKPYPKHETRIGAVTL